MAYTPVYIGVAEYVDIRLALGLAGNDTTTLADAVVEGRGFLPLVERAVTQQISGAAAIKTAGGDRAATMGDGVVLATAARLARYWLGAKTGDEVQRVVVGPFTTQYRTGPEWLDLSDSLAQDAAGAFARVLTWGADPARLTAIGRTGPTRAADERDARLWVTDWRRLLWPPPVKGYEHDAKSGI